MSNLVTPMLTSVDKSPIDFYQPLCYNARINPSKEHQMILNDNGEWNDLEQLVTNNSSKCTSRDRIGCKKSFPMNNSFSSDASKTRQATNDPNLSDNLHLVAFTDSSDSARLPEQCWTVPHTENNSCSKACVNINMGYHDGSSMESVVSNRKNKEKSTFPLSNHPVSEISNTKTLEPKISVQVSDLVSNQSTATSSPPNYRSGIDQVKKFKNNSKTGHSRQWGSCGSAGTLQLFDNKNITDKPISLENKPRSQSNVSEDTILTPQSEIRNRSYGSNTNKLKRISQVSFEAEFDSEGRTHEQTSIDTRKWDHNMIAGQITSIELSYFKALKAEEFLSFKWTGLSKHIHAPAIVASTRWFNQLNFWAQRIVLECTDVNRRAEMLSYIIRIIKKLVDGFNNLSSGMALMSALQVECIHRLKQTWNNVSNKDKTTFRRMEELFSSENNYEKLRDHINSLKLPCIPYIGLYLTDLTYINIAHSKLSEFESQTKTDQINNILRTVSEFQQSEYNIEQQPALYRYLESQRYIEELQKIIEENNYRTSVSLEPIVAETSVQASRQQTDFPNLASLSPQKTPPSYACKHSANTGFLQSPISPQQMSNTLLNESIKEVSEHPSLVIKNDNQNSTITDENLPQNNSDDGEMVQIITNQALIPHPVSQDPIKGQLFDLKVANNFKEDDSVHASLLCGSGRKSNYKKKSSNKSIRFKRDSSSSSHQQVSSKTATLSSGSHAASVDKDVAALHSLSLLDDSYLDATLTDTYSIQVAGTDVPGPDPCKSGFSSKHKELLCSPPICRCKIKGDIVDLKPKSSSKRKTEMRNLVKIAQAAISAAQYSKKCTNIYPEFPVEFENLNDTSLDDSPTVESKESVKLLSQGVLSRKICLKNKKKPTFPMWNRYWVVLIVSANNAYFVYFENSNYRASERKDFKYKKCHVQDLRGVTISTTKPSSNTSLSESDRNSSESPANSDHKEDQHLELKRFFLVDKEYGTIYKFRESVSKLRKSVDIEHEQCLQSTSSSLQILNLTGWYRLLSHCIRKVNRPVDYNKDLIVLNDS